MLSQQKPKSSMYPLTYLTKFFSCQFNHSRSIKVGKGEHNAQNVPTNKFTSVLKIIVTISVYLSTLHWKVLRCEIICSVNSHSNKNSCFCCCCAKQSSKVTFTVFESKHCCVIEISWNNIKSSLIRNFYNNLIRFPCKAKFIKKVQIWFAVYLANILFFQV